MMAGSGSFARCEIDAMETQVQERAMSEGSSLQHRIVAALREIYDPELPVNIYDLGLIYDIESDTGSDEGALVKVTMTLTAPACPVAGTLPGMVENAIRQVEGVADAKVDLVWDPPWSVEKMSDEARLTLGMYD
jgi:FeS assembly SUF system protein